MWNISIGFNPFKMVKGKGEQSLRIAVAQVKSAAQLHTEHHPAELCLETDSPMTAKLFPAALPA